MQVTLRNKLIQRALMVLESAVFLAAVVCVFKAYLGWRMAERRTVKDLQLGVRLDPSNSEYRLRLGRILQYNVLDIDPGQAAEQLTRAAELNPFDPQPWLELGTVRELEGKLAEAETCLRRADFLAPNLPATQWVIGNFFLASGNVDEAFRHLKIVLGGSSKYDQTVFSTAWKASGDAQKILEELIPNHLDTEFAYLYFLLGQRRYSEALSVWKRVMEGSETFSPARVSAYIEELMRAHRPADAYRVWADLQTKGVLKAGPERTDQNLLTNGDFEAEPLNMGFDWHVYSYGGVDAGLDPTTFHSPNHSLLIEFGGKENVDYRGTFQYVKVEPGRAYRLQGFVMSEGITTDSGPRLEVRDIYNPTLLQKFSEALIGSSSGWRPLTIDFTANSKTEWIVVGVTRPPSAKFDNLIAGKIWVDDLSLTPLPAETARAR